MSHTQRGLGSLTLPGPSPELSTATPVVQAPGGASAAQRTCTLLVPLKATKLTPSIRGPWALAFQKRSSCTVNVLPGDDQHSMPACWGQWLLPDLSPANTVLTLAEMRIDTKAQIYRGRNLIWKLEGRWGRAPACAAGGSLLGSGVQTGSSQRWGASQRSAGGLGSGCS